MRLIINVYKIYFNTIMQLYLNVHYIDTYKLISTIQNKRIILLSRMFINLYLYIIPINLMNI